MAARCQLTKTPEMDFVSRCKEGDFQGVVELVEGGFDPDTKGYVYYKNRLLGVKYSSDWGKYIMTHQSGERMMGSALHYACMGERWNVVGLLLAVGATPNARLNLPPHMPQEVTVEELCEKHSLATGRRLITLFRVWTILPSDDPKKTSLLEKLPEETQELLKPYLLTLVRRHLEDPALKLLRRPTAPSEKPPAPTLEDVDRIILEGEQQEA
eukprot:TRINITY_DN46995_c0_g1_i1.p2 TRINITY_DN46995_c0_g1~~TRINITY_DN46995_c0_g1_i1.p2  ORF type:complete len:212 (+),score=82.75 TRINITY_DN46995_c0_g1_i1:110-745(+)